MLPNISNISHISNNNMINNIIQEIGNISEQCITENNCISSSLSRLLDQLKLLSQVFENSSMNEYQIRIIIILLISIRDFLLSYVIEGIDLNKFVLLVSYREKYYMTMSFFHREMMEIIFYYRPDIIIDPKKERELNQKSLIHEITYSTKEFLKKLFSLKKENSFSFQNFQKDLLTNYSNNDIDQDILLKLKSLDGTDHRNYSLEETLLEVTNEFEASLEAHAQDFVVELDEIQNVILTLKRILYNDTNDDDNYSQSKLSLLEEHVSKCFFSVKLLDDVRRDLHVMMLKKKIHLSEDLYHEVERLILTLSNKVDTFIFQYQYPGEVKQITNLIDQYRTNSGEDNNHNHHIIIVQEMIDASFYFFQDRIFPLQSSSITWKEWIQWKNSFLSLSNSKETEDELIFFTQLLEEKLIAFGLLSYYQDLQMIRSYLSRLVQVLTIYKSQENHSNQTRLHQYCQNLENKFRNLLDTYEKETPSKYDPLHMNFFSLANFHVLLLKLGQEIAKNHDFNRYNHFQQQLFHEMILLIEEKFPKLVDRNTTEEYSQLLHQAIEIERNRPIFLFLFPEIVSAMIFSFLPSNELTKLQEIFHNSSKYRKLLDQILSSTEGIHRVTREKQQRKEYEVACQRDWWNYGPNYRMLNRNSTDEILSLTQLTDGRIVYSAQSDSCEVTVRFLQPSNGMCERVLYLPAEYDSCPNIFLKLHDERLVIDHNNLIQILDIHQLLQDYPVWKKDILCDGNNTKEIQSQAFHINCICEIAHRKLAVNGLNHSINIHNIHTGEIELSLSGHEDLVRVLIELPDGKIASGCELGTIKIWNLQNGGVCERTIHSRVESEFDAVLCLASLGSSKIAAGYGNETLSIWNLVTGECERTFHNYQGVVLALPNERIAFGNKNNDILICHYRTGDCEKILKGHTDYIICLLQLADGRIASVAYGHQLIIWD